MTYRGRFAPSPTGPLHFGSLVTALGSWLCTRHAGGQWLVRVEDIDPPREVAGSAEQILSMLAACGLQADKEPLFQSRRIDAYDAAFERLRDTGNLFPCWCSRRVLEASGGIHRDGHCLVAADAQRPPAWRLRVPDIEVNFPDAQQGVQRENLRLSVGDFVIRRAEGFYSYQLACVVDDAFQGITEVVRGTDLLDSTARQIWLQRCLGLPTPRYRHLPLVLDEQGRKLSKSTRALPLDATDPLPALRRALAFLQQPLPPLAHDVENLLAAALERFSPALLSHCSGHCTD